MELSPKAAGALIAVAVVLIGGLVSMALKSMGPKAQPKPPDLAARIQQHNPAFNRSRPMTPETGRMNARMGGRMRPAGGGMQPAAMGR